MPPPRRDPRCDSRHSEPPHLPPQWVGSLTNCQAELTSAFYADVVRGWVLWVLPTPCCLLLQWKVNNNKTRRHTHSADRVSYEFVGFNLSAPPPLLANLLRASVLYCMGAFPPKPLPYEKPADQRSATCGSSAGDRPRVRFRTHRHARLVKLLQGLGSATENHLIQNEGVGYLCVS